MYSTNSKTLDNGSYNELHDRHIRISQINICTYLFSEDAETHQLVTIEIIKPLGSMHACQPSFTT